MIPKHNFASGSECQGEQSIPLKHVSMYMLLITVDT